MSSSSNITMRPRFKAFVRADDVDILVNLDLVRAIEPRGPGEARLLFGNGAADRIDVKLIDVQQLRSLMDP